MRTTTAGERGGSDIARVLIVEPDDGIAATLKRLLEDASHIVVATPDTFVAGATIVESPYPLVVLVDPRTDGSFGAKNLLDLASRGAMPGHAMMALVPVQRAQLSAQVRHLLASRATPVIGFPVDVMSLPRAVAEAAQRLPDWVPPHHYPALARSCSRGRPGATRDCMRYSHNSTYWVFRPNTARAPALQSRERSVLRTLTAERHCSSLPVRYAHGPRHVYYGGFRRKAYGGGGVADGEAHMTDPTEPQEPTSPTEVAQHAPEVGQPGVPPSALPMFPPQPYYPPFPQPYPPFPARPPGAFGPYFPPPPLPQPAGRSHLANFLLVGAGALVSVAIVFGVLDLTHALFPAPLGPTRPITIQLQGGATPAGTTNAALAVSPATLAIPCHGSGVVTLSNTGTTPLTWQLDATPDTVLLSSNSPHGGTLPSGQRVALTVVSLGRAGSGQLHFTDDRNEDVYSQVVVRCP